MFNFSKFFLGKIGFFGQENDIFEKWIHFLILLNRFKIFNFATIQGAAAPRTPWGGRVIAFWWQGVPPPEPKSSLRHCKQIKGKENAVDARTILQLILQPAMFLPVPTILIHNQILDRTIQQGNVITLLNFF